MNERDHDRPNGEAELAICTEQEMGTI